MLVLAKKFSLQVEGDETLLLRSERMVSRKLLKKRMPRNLHPTTVDLLELKDSVQ